jgi:aminomuconate-semialdehyde/2-hydroxymuconate-6-semialdehyde dehydrogenase
MTQSLVRIKNFIDGEFVEPAGGKYLDNLEPATGKPCSQLADSSLTATLLDRAL